MNIDKQNNITNDIASALSQFAEAKGESMMAALGGSSAEIANSIKTEFKNHMEDISSTELVTALTQQQEIQVANVGGDVVMKGTTMGQQAKLIAETLLSSKTYNDVLNNFASKVDAVAKKEDVAPLKNILGGVGGVVKDTGEALGGLFQSPGFIVTIVLVVLGVLVVGGIVLYVKFGMVTSTMRQ